MKCPRCHNQESKYFYKVAGQTYCRKCISFQRVYVDKYRFTKTIVYPQINALYKLDFDLSLAQQKISRQLVENYKSHDNSLVWAVCGSGKTEIVFELIQYVLEKGGRVCFCIPRRQLVIELYQRLTEAFSTMVIGLLYGGHIEYPEAQLIVCTMHQLYRFENNVGFDLMIADEVDAFPFYQNEVLNEMFNRCCLKNYVKMSATFSSDDIHDEKLLVMNRRYHGVDLPLPKVYICPNFLQKWIMLMLLKKWHKKTIVYVPTVEIVKELSLFLKSFHLRVEGVSSKHNTNEQAISLLKDDSLDVIVSTTLLERGITIEDVQVIVIHSDHVLFDERTLIQIAGRVGRKPDYPTGHICFLTNYKTKEIRGCLKTINRLNTMNV